MSNTMQTFIFLRDGKPEKVIKERWCWVARYIDGTELKQFDDATGQFHQFREIDQAKLHSFHMVNDDASHKYTIVFDPRSMKLVHFYRNFIFNAGTIAESRQKVYMFGYEKRVFTKTLKVIFAITPTDELIAMDDPDVVQISSN